MIITPSEASKLICVGHSEMYKLLETGEIPAFKIGTAWKIPKKTLEEWAISRAIDEAAQRKEINNV